jgi:hypothetical protein
MGRGTGTASVCELLAPGSAGSATAMYDDEAASPGAALWPMSAPVPLYVRVWHRRYLGSRTQGWGPRTHARTHQQRRSAGLATVIR